MIAGRVRAVLDGRVSLRQPGGVASGATQAARRIRAIPDPHPTPAGRAAEASSLLER
jgi:hypothetical protein